MAKNTKNRSGVTLLFVISMIVLFLLMGSSFVIMSSQFRRSSEDSARVATTRDDARTLVNRAFRDLFRGPSLNDVFSPLRGHSILGDQYGYGMRSRVAGGAVLAGGQLFELVLDFVPGGNREQFQDVLTNAIVDFSLQGGTYDGQVLTFTSGPAEGISTRIVNYQVALSGGGNVTGTRFVVMPLRGDLGNVANLNGSEVLINGRPFVGSGAGTFDPRVGTDQPALDLNAYDVNQVGVSRTDLVNSYLDTTVSMGNPASVNESYDAPDYQNVFLAAIGDINSDGTPDVVARSFDRPMLEANVNRGRQSFRAANTGDVDNDGDGINDGIWVDTGLPLQTDARGRVYKPLVSYLVLDMDGKINVNAHGQLADLDANRHVPTRTGLLNGETPKNFGRGFGPAEISMTQLFGNDSQNLIGGRYGADLVPGLSGVGNNLEEQFYTNKAFGLPTNGFVGRQYGSPVDIMGRFAIGTPTTQVNGVPIGMPVVDFETSSWGAAFGQGSEFLNNPYEMSFRDAEFDSSVGGFDSPYNAKEMERVLRRFDSDTKMLPDRLRRFTNDSVNLAPSTRFAFTHASWEVPVPPSNVVTDLRNRLISEGVTNEVDLNLAIFTMLSPDLIDGLKMDPNRDFGNALDDNGNGVTDESWPLTGNGAIDSQLNESLAGEPLERANSFIADGAVESAPFDHDGFSLSPQDANLTPQQIFARHLYVLTLLMTEIDHDGDGDFDINDWHQYRDRVFFKNSDDIRGYRIDIAQWAINVANFRDPDSIMHPFEFDLEPFDGWDVDGNLSTNEGGSRRVVWGLERPEMLISEGLINHDRATEDRNDDDSMLPMEEKFTRRRDPDGRDRDLDSRFVPRASVFIELYNPWTTGDPVVNDVNLTYPAELYGNNGIDLGRMAGNTPVWQVVVTKSVLNIGRIHVPAYLDDFDDDTTNFDTITENRVREGQPHVLRRVYFAEPTAGGAEFTGNKVYFPNVDVGELPPGEQAVVGSAGIVEPGDRFTTYLGKRNDGDLTQTRRITLDAANSVVEQVFFDEGAGTMATSTSSAIVIPIGMQADGPRSLGATDPTEGYESLLNPGTNIITDADGFRILDRVADIPLDTNNPTTPLNLLQQDGLSQRDAEARVVHLRRLANPLVPFDADLNPYLTIDSLRLPINTFNGEAAVDEQGNPQIVDPTTGVRRVALQPDAFVTSRERGANSSTQGERMLWQSDQLEMSNEALALYPTTDFGNADGHIHSFNFANSLGELDVAYRLNPDPVGHGFSALTWNNRPFISHLEMVNVPFTSSFRLLPLYGFNSNRETGYIDHRAGGAVQFGRRGGAGAFGHLLNFFADSGERGGTDPLAPHLYRVMDYLEVPSRFIGTETFLNPNDFSLGNSASGLGLNAPFNKVSNYRYPGKVNINTIYDERVWNGVMRANGLPGNYIQQMSFERLVATRRQTGQAVPSLPTIVPYPFRSGRSVNHIPEPALFANTDSGRGSHTGLFRRRFSDERSLPLFDVLNPAAEAALIDPATGGPFEDLFVIGPPPPVTDITSVDPDRNSIFRYDMRQRLGNLVTTRSSVFAIWITVGFFEVDLENSPDIASPVRGDIVFGEEIGSDSGEVQRYRGFYLVDRSIPVGFEPGEDHNVDQAILASSIIQRGENNN